jgi:hypothetical protein
LILFITGHANIMINKLINVSAISMAQSKYNAIIQIVEMILHQEPQLSLLGVIEELHRQKYHFSSSRISFVYHDVQKRISVVGTTITTSVVHS